MNVKRVRRRTALIGAALALTWGLVSCGGGEQVQAFSPSRVIAFGDETSVIDDSIAPGNGRKYTVNATVSATDPTIECTLNPIWIQVLATAYGRVFPQCNHGTTPVASPTSRIRAAAGAKVADLSAQIDAQAAESSFSSTDLVTVLIGQNDVLAQYAQYPAVGETQLTANVEAAGTLLGQQVNRLAGTGAKVLIATIPNQGITPFAMAERTAHADIDRAALLSRLTVRFNASMRATIVNDGRQIGLILLDEYLNAVFTIVNAGGFTNVITPVCDLTKSMLVPPSVLDCTTLTLIENGSPLTYLWADTTLLTPGAHQALGNLATSRAQNNPF